MCASLVSLNCESHHKPHHRYDYEGRSHAKHGGVKVTYKDRLSRVGTHKNAEWAPVVKVTEPGPTPGSAAIERTVTTADGVLFIPHPPDLRREPKREEWHDEKPHDVAHVCKKILEVRHRLDLTVEARKEWHLMHSLHKTWTHAGESHPRFAHSA